MALRTVRNADIDTDLTTIALSGLDATAGMVVQTGADAFTKRTLAVGTGLSIADASGAAGAPTISLGSNLAEFAAIDLAANWPAALGAALGSNWATHLGKPLPFIFAADYGVSKDNSAAANYTAIEALITAITAIGQRVWVIWPAGFIYTTGGHVLNTSYQSHFGAGGINRNTAILSTTATVLFTLGNGTTLTNDYAFKGIGFYTPAGGTGIWQRYVQNVYIDDFYTNCDTFLRLGDATATGAASRTHISNGEGAQVASSTLFSHIKFEWFGGEYKRHNVNIEGQRQVSTIGTDFAANKDGATIDGLEWWGGYEGRFDNNVLVGDTRITNGVINGCNFEGGGTTAFSLITSSATGGLGQCNITNNNFGTDAVDGAWAASPTNPVRISINNASVTMDATVFADNTYTTVSRTTCFYLECLAGAVEGCRFGGVSFRGVMTNASQFLSHIKGAASGGATIKNCTHGPVRGISFTNALAGGVKYEGVLEMPAPDAGKVPSTVTYFVDDSHTVPLRQAFALTIVNTAGTMQHKVNGIGGGTAAAKAEFISRFTGFSTTLQNTPTATDSSTAMAGGGKIRSGDSSQFIFDSIATQTTNESIPAIRLTGNTSGNALFFQASFINSNVNGVTLNRLVIQMFRESDGTGFGINTTNLTAGEQVVIEIDGLFL